ncbi:MAG: ATP-binding cassette domain-containing protein [Deltaproteobacteria bacterium]|nr:MAG: ATP-binding cassette domain-containing protein [Deltaproteobacteria bacterium]
MRQYRRLLSYLRPYLWPRFVLAVACMLSRSAVETSVPFLARFTFDQVFHQQHPEALPLVVLLVLGAAFLRGGLDFVGGYLNDWVGQRVVTDLRNELTAHIQRLDLAFFNRRRAGQIVSRVISDVGIVRGAVTDAVTSIFQEFPTLLGLTVTAFYLDWVLALLAICLFPAAALPIRYLSLQLRQTTRRMQDGIGRLNALLHENVQGNRVVKAFGQEGYEQRRFDEHNERLLRIYMRTSVLRALPITEMLAGIAVAGIIWYGGSSVISGARTQGSFMAFIIALFLLYEPFKKLVRTNNTIQQGLAGAERVFELLDTAPQVVDRPGAVALRGVRAAIEFHAVSFAYDPGEPVLRDINLRIPVGQVVALVGMSGGGKSTLADLIPRFYDVTAGRITIDGTDIRDLTLASLRTHIAVVTQFTFLFNDSVRNNIAYGDSNRSMDEIVAAARAANAHDFIVEMSRGYETGIGDLGVRLSGGQRQRLAIARALLKNAPILILDEATSALDTESEGLVQEALERLMANRTTLVVAHRLSTVRRADRIVVVVRGEIVESGTHDELLARGAEYRKLYELQFRDVEALEGGADVAADSVRARKAAP